MGFLPLGKTVESSPWRVKSFHVHSWGGVVSGIVTNPRCSLWATGGADGTSPNSLRLSLGAEPKNVGAVLTSAVSEEQGCVAGGKWDLSRLSSVTFGSSNWVPMRSHFGRRTANGLCSRNSHGALRSTWRSDLLRLFRALPFCDCTVPLGYCTVFLRRVLNNSLRLPFYGIFSKKVGVILSLCVVTCCWCHKIFHGRRQRKFFMQFLACYLVSDFQEIQRKEVGWLMCQEYVGWEHRNFVICTLFAVKGRAKSASSYVGDRDIAVKLETLFLTNTLCSDANASVLEAN